jgi:hypothetical protein
MAEAAAPPASTPSSAAKRFASKMSTELELARKAIEDRLISENAAAKELEDCFKWHKAEYERNERAFVVKRILIMELQEDKEELDSIEITTRKKNKTEERAANALICLEGSVSPPQTEDRENDDETKDSNSIDTSMSLVERRRKASNAPLKLKPPMTPQRYFEQKGTGVRYCGKCGVMGHYAWVVNSAKQRVNFCTNTYTE